MRFNRGQFIAVALVAILVSVLTALGVHTSEVKNDPNGVASVKSIDIKSLVDEAENQLSPELKKRVDQSGKEKTGLQKLVVLWDSLGKPLPAAYYMWKLAEVDPVENNWLFAGSRYYNVALMSNDTAMFIEAGGKAKEAFQKVLQINSSNLAAKNSLAACYVDIDRDIMKGVGLLREVIAVDSNNTQALFTLGMLSIQSGQLEKAAQRFEKLVTLEPFNPEYYYYLGEVYAKSGDTEKAVQTYEKCKTLLKDKEAQKDVESIINKLKTI